MTEQGDTSHKDRKLSALYQQTEKAEPSASLDTLIQSAAHDAVKKTPTKLATPVGYRQKQSWFALAAVIALVAIALPIMLDESDQLLLEPDLTQRLPSSGILADRPAGTSPSVADAVLASPAYSAAPAPTAAPITELAAKIAPEQEPEMRLQKASPEKKARRNRLSSRPAEQAMPATEALKQQRQEARALPSKQKLYSDQNAPALSGSVAIPLNKTTGRADDEPLAAAVWQKQIRQLLQENQLDKARTELTNLQKSWPDFRVDPDLLEQTGLKSLQPATPTQ